ncbi:MAG: tetratricopeptide repeat protein [Planctomycetes bacterium]|nr:tetratricopeptide repeat protein [Planctomycetota bacterium]
MRNLNRLGRLNLKVCLILVVVLVVMGGSLFAAREIRRSILREKDLAAGLEAFDNQDWPSAGKYFREYLGRTPDDFNILKKYAQAELSIRPLTARSISRANSAYRQIIRQDPTDEAAYEKLVRILKGIGNFEDLAYIARQRLEHASQNYGALLWLGEALANLNKPDEARKTLEKLMGLIEADPGKHIEYVQACLLTSQMVTNEDTAGGQTQALAFLDKAIEYDPGSAEALARRARFYRQTIDMVDLSAEDGMALARQDLKAADELGTDNPRVRYFLASEWLAHGAFDRAAAELHAVEDLPQEVLEEHFLDIHDWTTARFLLKAELFIRQERRAEVASLADDMLRELDETKHRIRILPAAVRLYLMAGNVGAARTCLDEYLDSSYRLQVGMDEERLNLRFLQALVARSEGQFYQVIDTLLTAGVTDTSLPEVWRLLAEAYSRTDQNRRAVNALINYLRIRPRDPEVTLELAKEYLKVRDWNRAYETARLAEPLDPTNIILKLLRIESSIYLTVERERTINKERLMALSDELASLRRNHPERVDIRILQAVNAVYLEQPEQAEAELKLAIKECDDPLRAEMQLVRHYGRLKRTDDAIQVCKSACERHAENEEPWLSLSGRYTVTGDHASALQCLRQGLEVVSGQWEKRALSMRLAVLEIMHGDRSVGIQLLQALAEQDDHEIRARSLLLSIRAVQEDQILAKELTQELRRAEGESGLWWRLHQAFLYLSSEHWRSQQQDIIALLQYCIDQDPEWSAPPLLLAELYEKLEDVTHMEDVCRQALVRNPSATDIADRLITLLEEQGRFTEAEKVLQQIEANPEVTSAWRVRTAMRAGEFSRAITELKLRISNNDRDANSRVLLARLLYWQNRNAEEALAYLEEAEALETSSMALIAVKVSILRAEGRTTDAQQILDDYVANTTHFNAYVMRGAYLAKEGEYERAEADYRKLTTFTDQGVAGYELLSNFYARQDQLDQAIGTLEEGLNDYPDNQRLQRALMKVLFFRGNEQDQSRAVKILSALEEKLALDPELMKYRAFYLLKTPTPQSLQAARQKLENLVKLEPTAVDAHLRLIELAVQAGELEKARDYATQALGSNPRSLPLLSTIGRVELELGNVQLAHELAYQVLQQDPNSAVAREIVVESAFQIGDRNVLEEAREIVRSGLNREPTNENLLLAYADILIKLDRPDEAISGLEAYYRTEEGKRSVAARIALSELNRLSGRIEKAVQFLEEAEGLAPKNQSVVHARFLWLVSQEQWTELEQISTQYLAAEKQEPEIVTRAAHILSGLEPTPLKQEAITLYEHALTLSPASVDAQLGLSAVLYQTGNQERSQQICRDLLQSHPNDKRVLNNLAWILQEHFHRYTEALEFANKGLRLSPDDPNILDTRATILSKMENRLADAKADFQKLVDLLPEGTHQHAKALLQLGRVCCKLKETSQATQHLKEALAIDQKVDAFSTEERAEIKAMLQGSDS